MGILTAVEWIGNCVTLQGPIKKLQSANLDRGFIQNAEDASSLYFQGNTLRMAVELRGIHALDFGKAGLVAALQLHTY